MLLVVAWACVKSLTLLRSIIYYNTSYTFNNSTECQTLQTLLTKTDIQCKIAKTHQLLCHLHDNQNSCINMAAKDVALIVDKINTVLEVIIKKQEYHDTLYFAKWRTLDIVDDIKQLEDHIDIFKMRFDDLVQYIMISSVQQ